MCIVAALSYHLSCRDLMPALQFGAHRNGEQTMSWFENSKISHKTMRRRVKRGNRRAQITDAVMAPRAASVPPPRQPRRASLTVAA
jgi:hypothetical protein